ncbi:MAG TPA: hypothetical protein VF071_09045 [Candidatus Limnocylindria bacterium]
MTPWLLLVALVAAINWAAFIALRGRWGRMALVMGLAALAGTAIGEAVGSATGLELLRIGDFHLVAASVGAQVAMLVTLLGAVVLPATDDAE